MLSLFASPTYLRISLERTAGLSEYHVPATAGSLISFAPISFPPFDIWAIEAEPRRRKKPTITGKQRYLRVMFLPATLSRIPNVKTPIADELLRLSAIQQKRHRPVINKMDLHFSLKFPCLDRDPL